MNATRAGQILVVLGLVLCVVALAAGEPAGLLPGIGAVAVGVVLTRTATTAD